MVSSARNRRLSRLRRLIGRSKARSEERAFVADGPVLVAEALRSGLVVEEILAAPDALPADVTRLAEEAGSAIHLVDADVLRSVLDPVNPRPIAAVVAKPEHRLDAVAADRPLLVAVELRDPGNMGTVIRTAEAAGFGAVVAVGASVDPFSPKAVRASAGSVLRLPIVEIGELEAAFAAIGDRGWPRYCAVVDPEATPYDQVDLVAAAIVVGNEPHGLPPEAIRLGDARLTIPVSGTVESLNVAAAASVLCFESARQRRAAVGRPKSVGQETGEPSA